MIKYLKKNGNIVAAVLFFIPVFAYLTVCFIGWFPIIDTIESFFNIKGGIIARLITIVWVYSIIYCLVMACDDEK